MKTMILGPFFLLSLSVFCQQPSKGTIQWVLASMEQYGTVRNPYMITIDEVQFPTNVKTRVTRDSSSSNGIKVFYREYGTDKNGLTIIKTLRLNNIVRVEKSELLDHKAITVYTDRMELLHVHHIGADRDTTRFENTPRGVVDIVLNWRGEKALYRKMYKRLSEIALINNALKQYTWRFEF